MMVVPVLITSCQVWLKPNSGPVMAHATTVSSANPKHSGLPVNFEIDLASVLKVFEIVTASAPGAQGASQIRVDGQPVRYCQAGSTKSQLLHAKDSTLVSSRSLLWRERNECTGRALVVRIVLTAAAHGLCLGIRNAGNPVQENQHYRGSHQTSRHPSSA